MGVLRPQITILVVCFGTVYFAYSTRELPVAIIVYFIALSCTTAGLIVMVDNKKWYVRPLYGVV